MSRFVSAFATKLDAMLAHRVARGFKEEKHLRNLLRLDKFCAENYPQSNELTSEIVYAWLDSETLASRNSLITKATAIW